MQATRCRMDENVKSARITLAKEHAADCPRRKADYWRCECWLDKQQADAGKVLAEYVKKEVGDE